ncbi:ADP-ribosylglycohydrolase [Saccharopolyspora kobensis]|uniref:ADP-ribosylglycohydrolase n=1 Tax=Saccharopolyspora kobensis TaxID=146035 RepID=A0A1H6EFT1_9PSEU|nr:ADP-ribosylglycohydrolase family protein [Saccharopolyspora kobensis]SEG95704.1 ADP-ribosylglycohydrolase [Saccharopolyspora kobensis]SFD53964.1 ADP-ribosylglycohydrolase [Saccharopolyspora kobensis]
MRDERVAPKGWPKEQRYRRSTKVGELHREWSSRVEAHAEFRPQGRKEGSDYNLHYVDIDSPPEVLIDFDMRSREIEGRHPERKLRIPDPDPGERFSGALLSAVVGDALGRAVDTGVAFERSWRPSVMLEKDQALVDYSFRGGPASSSGTSQLLAFTLEGLIRAHTARRMNPVDADPVPEVHHAYQRWLYTQRVPWGSRGRWPEWGGPFAARSPEPDGWLVHTEALFGDREQDSVTVAALESFARTGLRPQQEGGETAPGGSDAVPRAAMAAVWSNDPEEVFSTAVNIAALTHPNPDDHLPAATLAVLLHQQIRDVPFFDCIRNAVGVLRGWPAHEKSEQMMRRAFNMIREDWVPAPRERVLEAFNGGGSDGAEALGLAMYCAMASDYVREAVLLAMNYTAHRSVVGAISGLLIGAECGVQAVPRDLSGALVLGDVVRTLADDVLVEFSPGPPTDGAWLRRYPAW